MGFMLARLSAERVAPNSSTLASPRTGSESPRSPSSSPRAAIDYSAPLADEREDEERLYALRRVAEKKQALRRDAERKQALRQKEFKRDTAVQCDLPHVSHSLMVQAGLGPRPPSSLPGQHTMSPVPPPAAAMTSPRSIICEGLAELHEMYHEQLGDEPARAVVLTRQRDAATQCTRVWSAHGIHFPPAPRAVAIADAWIAVDTFRDVQELAASLASLESQTTSRCESSTSLRPPSGRRVTVECLTAPAMA